MKIDNTFLNFNEFLAKYGRILDFVSYNGIIDAMPKIWKINIRNRYGANERSPDKYVHFMKKNQGTSFIYTLHHQKRGFNSSIFPVDPGSLTLRQGQ